MLNPIVTLISGQVTHPFVGGRRTTNYTLKHVPLIWEAMLGTVYARTPHADKNPRGEEGEYFDYNYAAAHKHARVSECTDLRVCRVRVSYQGWPRKGKLVLWGIPPENQK